MFSCAIVSIQSDYFLTFAERLPRLVVPRLPFIMVVLGGPLRLDVPPHFVQLLLRGIWLVDDIGVAGLHKSVVTDPVHLRRTQI